MKRVYSVLGHYMKTGDLSLDVSIIFETTVAPYFVNRIIDITFTFIIIVLRCPISLHSRSGFIFVKLIMMSENNFDRGEVWLIADVT